MVIGFPTFAADLVPDFVVHTVLTHTLITLGTTVLVTGILATQYARNSAMVGYLPSLPKLCHRARRPDLLPNRQNRPMAHTRRLWDSSPEQPKEAHQTP